MASYKTLGIIIKKNNFGEADRIFTIFSRHYGKIKAIAKGVRRANSRKGGSLGLFNLVSLFLAEGRSLDIITEVELVQSFENLRQDLKRLSSAFYLCELIEELTRERQISGGVFSLLKEALEFLNRERKIDKSFFANFQKNLLTETGFGVPEGLNEPEDIEKHIESIIEKELKSRRIWKRLP